MVLLYLGNSQQLGLLWSSSTTAASVLEEMKSGLEFTAGIRSRILAALLIGKVLFMVSLFTSVGFTVVVVVVVAPSLREQDGRSDAEGRKKPHALTEPKGVGFEPATGDGQVAEGDEEACGDGDHADRGADADEFCGHGTAATQTPGQQDIVHQFGRDETNDHDGVPILKDALCVHQEETIEYLEGEEGKPDPRAVDCNPACTVHPHGDDGPAREAGHDAGARRRTDEEADAEEVGLPSSAGPISENTFCTATGPKFTIRFVAAELLRQLNIVHTGPTLHLCGRGAAQLSPHSHNVVEKPGNEW
mmetsp:Transcript_90057/g.188295  ORF Transcript_90057/g.188295 Transcript_90057/m.188295 type:complete len:304 (+) Transcript_90057:695-1606(+)|eukprot:CAMPEP_0206456316 /NCGR_PEP_ID=MMETSP0324_2-20121206/22292_1 /ASSEMBLY_ACC=CAM_ASM_000836 /TAXON_ID=2866 /ORGANISM="Crypthecodinium cohnii, Strain Seligo" /LENGTH=303 /DNA_ID=CAMNT_0053927221 /DNA_START=633 /DNA_END=1544 /DNA_ORIENTATION=+